MDQTITINGVLFVITLDKSSGVTKIVTPGVRDPGNPSVPFTIEYDPAGTLANVYAVYALLLSLGLV